MAVLDSTFLIAIERGTPAALARFAELKARREPMRVPAAAWVEYLSSFTPSTRAKASRILEESAIFEPFTRALADDAARIQFELRREGKVLGWHDLQIAATALAHNESLVSADAGFAIVPGLDVLAH